MAEAEGVECTWEKSDLLYFFNVEPADLKFIFTDKSVYVLEDCGIVEKVKFTFTAVFVQRQYAFAAMAENVVLFVKLKMF